MERAFFLPDFHVYTLTHLIIKTSLKIRYYYDSSFTDEETGAQRIWVTQLLKCRARIEILADWFQRQDS